MPLLRNPLYACRQSIGRLTQAEQFERLLIARRVGPRLIENDFGLWAEVNVATVLGEHCFDWLRTPLPPPAVLGRQIPSDIRTLVLVGMGGAVLSAIAYQCVARRSLKVAFRALNSTSPDALTCILGEPPQVGCHYVIASKSGETRETLYIAQALFEHIHQPRSFTVITDAGASSLRSWAVPRGISIFTSDRHVPGRFSSLGRLSLIPAAISGIDVALLRAVREEFIRSVSGTATDPVHRLAAELASASMDGGELVIDTSSDLLPVAGWLEQLVAESLGKNGLGVLPVIRKPTDRFDPAGAVRVRVTHSQGGPGFGWQQAVTDVRSLAVLFLTWQTAVSMAAYLLGIDPYSQPEVERAKRADLVPSNHGRDRMMGSADMPYRYVIEIHSAGWAERTATWIHHLSESLRQNDYIALLGYLNPSPEIEAELTNLAAVLETGLSERRVRTVHSFGPQYLHSVGQFYKTTARDGALRTGHFLFIDADAENDFNIPALEYSFGWLIRRQAHLDAQYHATLAQSSSSTLSLVRCGTDVAASLRQLASVIQRVVHAGEPI